MNILDNINYVMDKELKKKVDSKKAALVWLVTEIVQIVVCVIGALLLLWLYAPFSFFAKCGITTLSLLVVYDVFKSFVYVRWILLKESI